MACSTLPLILRISWFGFSWQSSKSSLSAGSKQYTTRDDRTAAGSLSPLDQQDFAHHEQDIMYVLLLLCTRSLVVLASRTTPWTDKDPHSRQKRRLLAGWLTVVHALLASLIDGADVYTVLSFAGYGAMRMLETGAICCSLLSLFGFFFLLAIGVLVQVQPEYMKLGKNVQSSAPLFETGMHSNATNNFPIVLYRSVLTQWC